jgi:hypothetical protein
MRSRFGGTMTTIVLSSVLSAGVAVVVTQVVAPQYASAKSHSKGPTLASLSKTVSSDYTATSKQLGVIESDLVALKTSVAAVSSNASAANTNASAANANASAASSAVTAITPVVHTIAERLYDTCALTSDLWSRSFPDFDGQDGTAWTESGSNELSSLATALLLPRGLGRCYALHASVDEGDPQTGGALPPDVNPDDSWTATAP